MSGVSEKRIEKDLSCRNPTASSLTRPEHTNQEDIECVGGRMGLQGGTYFAFKLLKKCEDSFSISTRCTNKRKWAYIKWRESSGGQTG